MNTSKRRSPSTPFTRAELQQLAVNGAWDEICAMEQRLARLHRAFPHLFASDTPPVFARAEDKPPTRAATRFAEAVITGTARLVPHRKAGKGKRLFERPKMWERAQHFLASAEGHRATNKQLKSALGMTDSNIASLVKGKQAHLFKRVETGVYELTKAGLNGAAG